MEKNLNRRKFIRQTVAGGVGLSIIPSHVLGGSGKTSANNKINVALIGSGTQALNQLPDWLKRDELQFVSVCDPNRESRDYPLWGQSQGEAHGAAGGREIGRKKINSYYAEQSGNSSYNGCTAYADFRELHRWTNRPMWAQGSPYLPGPAPIPDGFDWQHGYPDGRSSGMG